MKGAAMPSLFDDAAVVQRILDHIDNQSTDLSDQAWREPVEHYRSEARFAAELDGALRHVPHEHGFPGLDKQTRGLVAIDAVEVNGIVFVTQQPSQIPDARPAAIPELFTPRHRLLGCEETEVVTNWKIVTEGFL